jgi:BRCT domain type II-containing protein
MNEAAATAAAMILINHIAPACPAAHSCRHTCCSTPAGGDKTKASSSSSSSSSSSEPSDFEQKPTVACQEVLLSDNNQTNTHVNSTTQQEAIQN